MNIAHYPYIPAHRKYTRTGRTLGWIERWWKPLATGTAATLTIAFGYGLLTTAQHFWPTGTMLIWDEFWRPVLVALIAVMVILEVHEFSLRRVEGRGRADQVRGPARRAAGDDPVAPSLRAVQGEPMNPQARVTYEDIADALDPIATKLGIDPHDIFSWEIGTDTLTVEWFAGIKSNAVNRLSIGLAEDPSR